MLFQIWRRTPALLVAATLGISAGAFAKAPAEAPLPITKTFDVARSERRSSKSGRSESFRSEKKSSKKFSYSYLLPFGAGQFERDKSVMGTAFATAQAGFLLLYFDRINAVRSANADAADVMRGVDTAAAGNDPTIVSFLDQNEKFALNAQKQANMALIGFFALYTAGVVEAVFDPFGKAVSKSGKRKKRNVANGSTEEQPSDMAQELRKERESRVGLFFQPIAGAAPAWGLSLEQPL